MAEQKSHTAFAMQALGFADLFNVKVGEQRVSGATPYRVEMSAPDGPSTGGGKQAVQHIKLVPDGGQAVIVAGSANQVDKTAELRTFEFLAHAHGQRFKGAKIPLDRVQYLALVKRAQNFFNEHGISVTTIDAPRSVAPAAPAKTGMSSGTIVAIVIVVAALIAGAFLLVLKSKHGAAP
jgi:LPXTG-motif cell wall-anchored protein